jgi:hypothetical protein
MLARAAFADARFPEAHGESELKIISTAFALKFVFSAHSATTADVIGPV